MAIGNMLKKTTEEYRRAYIADPTLENLKSLYHHTIRTQDTSEDRKKRLGLSLIHAAKLITLAIDFIKEKENRTGLVYMCYDHEIEISDDKKTLSIDLIEATDIEFMLLESRTEYKSFTAKIDIDELMSYKLTNNR